MSRSIIPIANLQRSGAKLLTCHGCRHNWYSARDGLKGGDYPGRPAILSKPHSRCTALAVYVPMIIGQRGEWLGSEVPKECPEHQQQEMF